MYGEEVSDTQRHDETMGVQYNYLAHAESVQCGNAMQGQGQVPESHILILYILVYIYLYSVPKISVWSAKRELNSHILGVLRIGHLF